MAGPYDHLIGELTPGAKGWLPLDDTGTPSGPATLQPPPELNAKAASVQANSTSPVPEDEHALYTSSGAEIVPPLNSNVDRRVTPGTPEPIVPSISLLNPATAVAGDPDSTLMVTGNGFTAASVIVFGGVDQATTFGTGTSLTCALASSTASAGDVPVEVRDSAGTSNSVNFSFTAPVGMRGSEERGRSRR